MNLNSFTAKYPAGSRIDTDGFPASQPYQCVDLIKRYLHEVFGMPIKAYGDAVAYWKNPEILARFDRITDGSKQDGDILIWGNDAGTFTGVAGHIAIWYKGKIYNQNYNGNGKITLNSFFSAGYVGALRIKGGEEVIPDNDNDYNRWALTSKYIRSRVDSNNQLVPLTRAEFRKSAVGKTWLQALEILEDNNSEAVDTLETLQTGEDARDGNWIGQIKSLKETAKAQDAKIKELQSGGTTQFERVILANTDLYKKK